MEETTDRHCGKASSGKGRVKHALRSSDHGARHRPDACHRDRAGNRGHPTFRQRFRQRGQRRLLRAVRGPARAFGPWRQCFVAVTIVCLGNRSRNSMTQVSRLTSLTLQPHRKDRLWPKCSEAKVGRCAVADGRAHRRERRYAVIHHAPKKIAPQAFDLRRYSWRGQLRRKRPAVVRQHAYIVTVSATSLKSAIWSKFMYL
ncbi:hypothetical protein SAMN06295900_11318 [Trinickia caryophylli]|uniref:Uncharacterized protein n=1 Tax=Trinickia caryophylli TaxID=28094 RepID=A0A1X7G207_TRICW|nr:hypothetical protein SAMN06295900_11318 [Trinickia caryophylli]